MQVASGIAWVDDIQSFYRERSLIEREYSAKLTALARRYHEKKARKIGNLSVGDTPTLTPGSLESASLTTWSGLLSTVEKRAAEHERFANELVAQIADVLRNVALRYEDVRRNHSDYAARLEKEHETNQLSLKRSKGIYDGACQELESKRKKADSSFDMNKAKAQASFQNQTQEMNNAKNTYLISINVTNVQKEKYYHEYIPELLNSMQSLSETRTAFLNSIWVLATKLEKDTLSRSVELLQSLGGEIVRNNPRLDSMMFARHNVPNWQEPPDVLFEASPVWHDDSKMITDEAARVFLRNILSKSKGQRNDLRREVDWHRQEVGKAKAVREDIREGRDQRDEVDAVRHVFSLQTELHESERRYITAEVETATIVSEVGDISVGAQNHAFKSQTFKIPTNCDLCGERIWGLSAKGFDCRDCGYTCHSKCELKVPADCPGEQTKDERKKLKAERQQAATSVHGHANGNVPDDAAELADIERSTTMNSLSSGYATSARRSVSGLGPTSGNVHNGEDTSRSKSVSAANIHEVAGDIPGSVSGRGSETRGRVLYPYQASGDGEVSVEEGQTVTVVEADDGGGWMTIAVGSATGVVPTSYVEVVPPTPAPATITIPVPAAQSDDRPGSPYSTSSTFSSGSTAAASAAAKKRGPAVAPRRGAKKLQHVEALYDYTAQSDAEWSMSEGDRFVLVTRDAGDGWAEVEKGGRVRSVPANYLQDV